MPNQITVPFYGRSLVIVNHKGEPYTPMKPIVEGMGIDWRSQAAKLRNNKDRWGVVNITTPTNGSAQNSLCLPLRKLFGWMQTLQPNKVKPSIRDRVIRYQNECDDVLWQYWTAETRQPVAHNPPRMRMLVSIEQGQVVSTQLVPSNCVVFDPSEIQQLIKEPGYFSVDDYRRIANTALEQLTKLASSMQR